MSDITKGAVIAAVSAILGALAGGWATYLSSKALQDETFSREEQREERRAGGVARVYAADLEAAATMLAAAADSRRWPVVPDALPSPGESDRELVQSRLSPRAAGAVISADRTLYAVRLLARLRDGAPFVGDDLGLVIEDIEVLERGAAALVALANAP